MYFLFLIPICFIYLLIRLNWVSKRQCEWNDKVYNYKIYLIHNSDVCKNNYTELINSIYSFNKMMLHFWQWNLEYMIENKKLVEKVLNYDKKT